MTKVIIEPMVKLWFGFTLVTVPLITLPLIVSFTATWANAAEHVRTTPIARAINFFIFFYCFLFKKLVSVPHRKIGIGTEQPAASTLGNVITNEIGGGSLKG
jgi:hypothetical protein